MSQQQKPAPHYTYVDYAKWLDEPRCELIHGEPVQMGPAPSPQHQEINGALFFQLYAFLRDRSCKVYAAPIDVRLSAATLDDTVVQPDLVVVCDPTKIDGKSIKGPPDLAVEILSPHSVRHDRVTKFRLYRDAGVPEYWIVDPQTQTLTVHRLKDGEYTAAPYAREDPLPVQTLPGLILDLTRVFPAPDAP